MNRLILLVLSLCACVFAARMVSQLSLPAGTIVTVIKFDAAGSLYVAGSVNSDGFVTKLSSDGSKIIYRRLLSGSAFETVNDMVVTPEGLVYVAGTTASPDFPVTPNAIQTTTGKDHSNAFYVRLDAQGAVSYSTLLGGDATSSGEGIAVDAAGAAYLTGGESVNISAAYIAKIDSAGKLAFHTNVVGNNHIGLDAQGNIYVAGTLLAANSVPVTAGAYQTKPPTGFCNDQIRSGFCRHTYVTKLDPTGQKLIYSTFVSGSVRELPVSFAVDPQGNVYLAGGTNSSDYPITPGAYEASFLAGPFPELNLGGPGPGPAPMTAFVTKLNPAGNGLVYSTFLGGSGTDVITSIAVDANGNAYVAGPSSSPDFPGLAGVPDHCTGGGYVTRLSADGSSLSNTQLIYGGAAANTAAVGIDAAGNTWFAEGNSLARVELAGVATHFACAVDSADMTVLGRLVPGQLVSLFGDNLALAQPRNGNTASGSYPTTLGQVSVTVNGFAAPLLYVSPTQVNIQVPFEVAEQATAHIQLALPFATGAQTEGRDFALVDRAPSAFVVEQGMLYCGATAIFGQRALALNPNGTINSCENPAPRGSAVTVFFQGVGVTSPPQVTGALSGPVPVPLNLPLAGTSGAAFISNAQSVPGSISGVWSVQLQFLNGLITSLTVAGVPLREGSLLVWIR